MLCKGNYNPAIVVIKTTFLFINIIMSMVSAENYMPEKMLFFSVESKVK